MREHPAAGAFLALALVAVLVSVLLGAIALCAWSFATSSLAWQVVGASLVLLIGVAACDQTRRA
jgi:hypothetical protein